MSDLKVSELSSIAGSAVDVDNDVLNIVDRSAGTSGSKQIAVKELVANTKAFTQSGTAASGTVASAISQLCINVKQPPYSATGDGVTNDTTAIQAAITAATSAGGIVFFPPGTYLVTGITLASNVTLEGAGMGVSTIKLKNSANAHVVSAPDCDKVSVRRLTIDGNKANQSTGTGNNWRCLYFTTTGSAGNDHNIIEVQIKNAVDHGLMFSDNTGSRSVVERCQASGCGSAGHSGGGGAGGTGFVGGDNSTRWIGCYSTGNYLNGFKSARGTWIGCEARDTVAGGGFETGFDSPDYAGSSFTSCRAINTLGDGFRHQGQGDELKMIGCEASGCKFAGVTLLNVVNKALVLGCTIKNNGNGGARTATAGIDGISILSSGATGPASIIIDNCHIFDDQGPATQAYGIYIENDSSAIRIGSGNIISGNLTGSFFIDSNATGDDIVIKGFSGYSGEYSNYTPASVTGTLAATDLMTQTLLASQFHIGSKVKITAAGTITGTAGTKTIRFQIGATAVIVSGQLAAETQRWMVEITLFVSAGTTWDAMIQVYEVGGTSVVTPTTVANSLTSDLIVKFTGQLGNTGDTITQTAMTVLTER